MPHLTLEYSRNLETLAPGPGLLADLHRLLETVGGIRLDNCKSRWWPVDDFLVGGGGPEKAFVHLSVRILEGRAPEVQQALGEAILERLRGHFSPVPEGLDLQITVELGEMRRPTYFKHPGGTLSPPPARKA